MKVMVCMLLLSGLLAGLAQGLSVVHVHTATQRGIPADPPMQLPKRILVQVPKLTPEAMNELKKRHRLEELYSRENSRELFDSPELFDSWEDSWEPNDSWEDSREPNDSWELFSGSWGRRKRNEKQYYGTQGHGSEGDGSAIGNWWRRFSGRVGDTIDNIGGNIEFIGDTVHQTFHHLKERVAYIVVRFKGLMAKFGIAVQEGIKYCIGRLQHSIHQGKHLEVIEKLETKLEEGHAGVVTFFQILGEKIRAWRQQHRYDDIDTGLTAWGHHHQTPGQQTQQMPNFYQDAQVLSQLNTLREQGVLTQDQIIILAEDQQQQNY